APSTSQAWCSTPTVARRILPTRLPGCARGCGSANPWVGSDRALTTLQPRRSSPASSGKSYLDTSSPIPLPHKPLCLTGATASTTVNAATAPQADNHRSTTRMLPSSTERQHKEPSTISGEPPPNTGRNSSNKPPKPPRSPTASKPAPANSARLNKPATGGWPTQPAPAPQPNEPK